MTQKESRSLWTKLSYITILIGILLWVPNLIFQYGYSCWMLTFIINPIGIIFGIIGKSLWGIIWNILLTFSFFIIMFFGYLIESLL